MKKDYYEILEISRDATAEEISKAYRGLAIKLHPDVNPDPEATERFKHVAEAFEVLSDQQKRQEYDRFGTVGGTHFFSHHTHINPFDMFGDFFAEHFQHNRGPIKGTDVYQELHITLQEAYQGCRKPIYSFSYKICDNCMGSGVTTWASCDMCKGVGKLHSQKGPFRISFTCTKCRGAGRIAQVVCQVCGGEGGIEEGRREHILDIPSGIETGIQLVVRGQGESTKRGVPGDLVCTIIVDPHPLYEREGHNLHCIIPVTFAQSVMGHELVLPLISGEPCTVKIPPRTKSGKTLRLKEKGMPVLAINHRQHSLFGDLLMRIQVEMPDNPSEDYLTLIENLSSLDDKEKYKRIDEFQTRIETLPKLKEKVS